jgi:hypothetical protein
VPDAAARVGRADGGQVAHGTTAPGATAGASTPEAGDASPPKPPFVSTVAGPAVCPGIPRCCQGLHTAETSATAAITAIAPARRRAGGTTDSRLSPPVGRSAAATAAVISKPRGRGGVGIASSAAAICAHPSTSGASVWRRKWILISH